FLRTHELRYFELLPEKEDETFVLQLVDELREQRFSLSQRDAIAALLHHINATKLLLDYIEYSQSLDLLRRYGAYLLQAHKQEAYRLHRQMIDTYLNQHFGPQAADRVADFIAHLRVIRASDLAAELLLDYRKRFADRPSLMEALEVF
ncbi:MAG: hypothetical protein AAFO94_17165, partial [Bacteroidota bacterium]